MGRRFVIAGMVGIMTLAACSDTTAPAASRIAAIYQIHVSDHATVGDTVRVDFTYAPGACDTAAVVEAKLTSDGMRFTARSFPTSRPCPLYLASTDIIAIAHRAGFVIAPPHVVPLTLVFTEPDGGDSVRVVSQGE